LYDVEKEGRNEEKLGRKERLQRKSPAQRNMVSDEVGIGETDRTIESNKKTRVSAESRGERSREANGGKSLSPSSLSKRSEQKKLARMRRNRAYLEDVERSSRDRTKLRIRRKANCEVRSFRSSSSISDLVSFLSLYLSLSNHQLISGHRLVWLLRIRTMKRFLSKTSSRLFASTSSSSFQRWLPSASFSTSSPVTDSRKHKQRVYIVGSGNKLLTSFESF
jgi:hypothetical protein